MDRSSANAASAWNQHEAACRQHKVQLSDVDRARVLALARDLPAVWHSPTATDAQRKTLLRTLVAGVTLTPIDVPTRQTRVQILWEGGAVTELLVARPRTQTAHSDKAMENAIRALFGQGARDAEIARELNTRGATTGEGRPWTFNSVRRVRRRLGLSRSSMVAARQDGLYSTRGVAEKFGVSVTTVSRWCRVGLLKPAKAGSRGHSAWFHLDETSVRRLKTYLHTGQTSESSTVTRYSASLKSDAKISDHASAVVEGEAS